ncbi:hypothetical protein [Nostoc sp.]|uniref:hypothetical protein n=1 Tax=Nostoc sp. TaxID=1180 RepID=UPI002FF740B7
MPRTPIHIQQPNAEVIFNWQAIKFIVKLEASVFVHFLGDDEPLHLEGEAAKAFWDNEYEQSNKIYPPVSLKEWEPGEM